MTTITRQRVDTPNRLLTLPIPVELMENDGQGNTWIKLAQDWVKLASIKNLWEMDGYREQQPVIRMHFRATTEDGQSILLVQDLLEGRWYCQLTLGGESDTAAVPIYRA